MILLQKYLATPAEYDKWYNVWKATIFITVTDSRKIISHVFGSTEDEANRRAKHFVELSNNHNENSEGFKIIFDALIKIEEYSEYDIDGRDDKGHKLNTIHEIVGDTLRKLNVERAEER